MKVQTDELLCWLADPCIAQPLVCIVSSDVKGTTVPGNYCEDHIIDFLPGELSGAQVARLPEKARQCLLALAAAI